MLNNYFSVLLDCPKCGSTSGLKVSQLNDHAFYCDACNTNFHSYECIGQSDETKSKFRLSFDPNDSSWFDSNITAIKNICKKYLADSYEYDITNEHIYFDWTLIPNDATIQSFVHDIITFTI